MESKVSFRRGSDLSLNLKIIDLNNVKHNIVYVKLIALHNANTTYYFLFGHKTIKIWSLAKSLEGCCIWMELPGVLLFQLHYSK